MTDIWCEDKWTQSAEHYLPIQYILVLPVYKLHAACTFVTDCVVRMHATWLTW